MKNLFLSFLLFFHCLLSFGQDTISNVMTSSLPTISTPTTGATVTLIVNRFNAINPAGTIAALTINFPDSPQDRDIVEVKFSQIITTITYVAGTGGATILGQRNAIVGDYFRWKHDSGTNSWY